jgi:hypothetical protein
VIFLRARAPALVVSVTALAVARTLGTQLSLSRLFVRSAELARSAASFFFARPLTSALTTTRAFSRVLPLCFSVWEFFARRVAQVVTQVVTKIVAQRFFFRSLSHRVARRRFWSNHATDTHASLEITGRGPGDLAISGEIPAISAHILPLARSTSDILFLLRLTVRVISLLSAVREIDIIVRALTAGMTLKDDVSNGHAR